MNTKRTTWLLSATLFLTLGFSSTHAATGGYLEVFVDQSAANCSDSVLVIESSWSYTKNDANGEDLVAIMAYDGAGNALASDWQGSYMNQKFVRLTAFGGAYSTGTIASRPITIELYDLSRKPAEGQNTEAVFESILDQSPPLLERLIYDPARDIDSCKTVPLQANIDATNELLLGRRLALGIPMMALLVLVPIRQARRNQEKTPTADSG